MIEHATMKTGPTVFSIPPDVSFVDQLAAGLRSRYGGDQLQLSDLVVLLPTRRAARSLQEAFLRLTGGAPTLLPRMLPIGEIDDDPAEIGLFSGAQELLLPPAIEPLRRRLLLARLIEAARPDLAAAQALELAGDLIGFLDQLQVANVALDELDGLVPADFACRRKAFWNRWRGGIWRLPAC
jgi:ATP-dependent helicase/nuclease subunit B